MDTYLITIESIRKYRKIAANFDTGRLNGFIYDTQVALLRNLIGTQLYRDLVDNYDPAADPKDKWNTLVEGDGAGFYGVEPYLCYFVLAAMAREANTWVTEKGFQSFSNAESSDAKDRREMESDYKTKAGQFGTEIIDFLEANRATYTSYVSKRAPKPNDLNWFIV